MFQRSVDPTPALYSQQSHQDTVETVVGPSVHVEGDFASEGNIIVKGTVSGSVSTSGLLTVEEGAKILANVRAGNAIVSGHIKGNMLVADRLELTETAQVLGDIQCAVFAVAAGALVTGKVTMKGLAIEDTRSAKRKAPKREIMEEESEMGEE